MIILAVYNKFWGEVISMDILKRIKFEYDGIKGNINKYSGDDYIANLLDELGKSINSEDKEEIIYLLSKVNDWYSKNQGNIQSNSYVFNKEQHLQNQSTLMNFYKELKEVNSNITNTVKKEDYRENMSELTKKETEIKKPKIFIGSSKENLEVAYDLQVALEYSAEPTVWTQGIFKLSSSTIDDLYDKLKKMDAAIFIFTPDDIAKIRTETVSVVRDNVIFELGLTIGMFGKQKVFYIIPNGLDIHLPSDLIGITPGYYDANRSDKNLRAALGPVVADILKQLKE